MRIVFLSIHKGRNINYSLAFGFLKSYLLNKRVCAQDEFLDVDCHADDDPDEIRRIVINSQPDLLAVSCYLWNVRLVLSLLHYFKKLIPQLTIVLGGPEFAPESIPLFSRHKDIDYIVVGEGEKPFYEIIKAQKAGVRPSGEGIIWRTNNGKAIFSGLQLPLAVEEIPTPHVDGGISDKLVTGKYAMLETQRGCPLRCAFCHYPGDGLKLRYIPLERVFPELEMILGQKPAWLYLMDPAFNSHLPRAKAILREIIRLGEKFGGLPKLHTEMIPEFMDEELIILCKEAGFKNIEVGIQSLQGNTLTLMQRYRDEGKLFANMACAYHHGVDILPQLIYGLPGDDFFSFLSEFDRIYLMTTQHINIFRLYLLPGTAYRKDASRLGIQFKRSPPYHIIQGIGFSRGEIEKLVLLEYLIQAMKIFKPLVSRLCESTGILPSKLLLEFSKKNRVAIRRLHASKHQKEEEVTLKLKLVDAFIAYCSCACGGNDTEHILQEMQERRKNLRYRMAREILTKKLGQVKKSSLTIKPSCDLIAQ